MKYRMVTLPRFQLVRNVLMLLLFVPDCMAGVAIVCNVKSPMSSITSSQAKGILLGRMKEFQNGWQIDVVHQKTKSAIREEMAIKVTGKSLARLNAVWAKRFFSGKIARPIEFSSDEDILRWVQTHDNAIGYIDIKNVTKDVTVLYSTD